MGTAPSRILWEDPTLSAVYFFIDHSDSHVKIAAPCGAPFSGSAFHNIISLCENMVFEHKNNAIPLTGGAGDDTMILKMDCISSGALPGTESMWEPFGAGNTGRFLHFIILGDIVENSKQCYTLLVTAPILATGRGCVYGIAATFCCLRIGQCSCLLPVQVAWWRWIAGNQAQTVDFSVKEEEPPNVLQYNRGFILFVPMNNTTTFLCLSAL